MTIHVCKECIFSTTQKSAYNIHLSTKKHKKNMYIIDNLDKSNNVIDKMTEIQKVFTKQNEELKNKIELLEKSNKELKDNNNKNINKIVKEAKIIKKSILTLLNTNFKDTPSIEYIKEDDFRTELELEYKQKINDPDNKLQLRIFRDYETKYLVETLSRLIIKFIKKDSIHLQPVFNVDASRGNYATKIDDIWHNDKTGLQLKKYTLDVIVKYILNVLDIFRLKLVQIRDENIKNKSEDKSDYIMKYSTLLLEVNAYLTNPKTHKQIILYCCPELQYNLLLN